MLEAIVIILALGGLEAVLWTLDHRQQEKQIELLESIWAELAIRNSVEEEREQGNEARVPLEARSGESARGRVGKYGK